MSLLLFRLQTQGSPRDCPPVDRRLALGLVLLATSFGAVVVHRNLFLNRPQGDLRVYCRAGWAVLQGGRLLYHVRDDNGWHYHYLPPFAILMAPLADPPRRDLAAAAAAAAGLAAAPGQAPLLAAAGIAAGPAAIGPLRPTLLPYAAAVVLIYLVNLACLAGSVHLLATHLPGQNDARVVWQVRLLPVVVCLPAVGLTLVRGQVQLLLLLLVVGFLVGLLNGRRFAAGLCLAGAIALKVFPVYLLLVPLTRRDGRCLAGCLVGLVGLLGVLPVAALGPETTMQLYWDRCGFLASVFHPGPAAPVGAAELLEATGSQSQSFQVVLHKLLHLGQDEVPALPAAGIRLAHWLIAGFLTAAAVFPGQLRHETGLDLARRVGLLSLLMVLICPVCHLHYLSLALPLVAVVLAGESGGWRVGVLAGFLVATAAPMLPGLGGLRDLGVPLWGALTLAGLAWWPVVAGGRGKSVAETQETRKKTANLVLTTCPTRKCDLRLG